MVPDAPFGSFLRFSDQVQIRATALRSYASPVLTLLWWQDRWRTTPSGAGPGAFLCRFLVLFTCCASTPGYLCSLVPWPGRHLLPMRGSPSVFNCHFHLASAGMVGILSLFSCLSLDGHAVPPEACLEFASPEHGSSAVDDAGCVFCGKHFLLHLSPHLPSNSLFGSWCFWVAFVGDALSRECSPLVASFGSSLSLSHGLVCLFSSCAVFSRCAVLVCCRDLRILGVPYPPLAVRRLCFSCSSFSGKQVLQASVLEKRPIQVLCRHPMEWLHLSLLLKTRILLTFWRLRFPLRCPSLLLLPLLPLPWLRPLIPMCPGLLLPVILLLVLPVFALTPTLVLPPAARTARARTARVRSRSPLPAPPPGDQSSCPPSRVLSRLFYPGPLLPRPFPSLPWLGIVQLHASSRGRSPGWAAFRRYPCWLASRSGV